MNDIAERQNQSLQLDRLAAQRQLYSTAKRILIAHAVLSGPLAVLLTFLGVMNAGLREVVGLYSVCVVVLDLLWLTPWQKRLRATAAGIQELFDCEVLELPWNGLKAGAPPDPELMQSQAQRYQRWADRMPPLRDWYPPALRELRLPVARVACQRANCWWDGSQRRHYALLIGVITLLVVGALFVIALTRQFTVEELLLRVLVPASPILLLGYRQFSEHNDAARRLQALKVHCGELWSRVIAGLSNEESLRASRNLQDEIFESRKRSPLVLDAVFRRLRPRYEKQMSYAAEELVEEARRRA